MRKTVDTFLSILASNVLILFTFALMLPMAKLPGSYSHKHIKWLRQNESVIKGVWNLVFSKNLG